MKKELARRIFTIVCSVFLLITVSFAWMLGNSFNVDIKRLVLDYTDQYTLDVDSQDLSIWIQMQNEQGEYVTFDEAALETAVPGEIVPFIIRFHNNTTSVITIDLSLSDITVKDARTGEVVQDSETGHCLLHHMFMRVVGDANVFQNVPATEAYKCLGDGLEGVPGENGYSVTVLDTLQVPYPLNPDEDYILTCYFFIDGEAGPEYQNQAISIKSFVAVIR